MDAPGDWWRRVGNKRAVARAFHDSAEHAIEAWEACGFAAEFALKGVIHARRGYAAWPTAATEPRLHTHNLERLTALAGLRLDDVPPAFRPSLRTVLSWSVTHRYLAAPVSPTEGRAMFEATFGPNGVIAWLKSV